VDKTDNKISDTLQVHVPLKLETRLTVVEYVARNVTSLAQCRLTLNQPHMLRNVSAGGDGSTTFAE